MARKMKSSGIEWIGEIPKHWIRAKVKHACSVIGSGTTPPSHNLDFYSDDEFFWIQSGDLYKQSIITSTEKRVSKAALRTYSALRLYESPFLVMAMYGASVGNLSVAHIDAATNQACCVMKANKKTNLMYLYYWLLFAKEDLLNKAEGGSQPNISQNKIKNEIIYFPTKIEQEKIADYLDKKTNQIEQIKTAVKQEIQTLEDYKKSVITEAVTKGLDKNAAMKDSGIEWIGEIPKHWEVIRVKNAALLKARIGWQGLRSDEFLYEPDLPFLVTGTDFAGGVVNWNNCVRISEKRFEMDKNIQVKENDLLITKDGTIGKLAIARNCPEKVSLNSGVFVIRNQGPYKYFDKYMYYLLQSEQFLLWFELNDTGNSTIRHLYQKDFYNFSFTYPPLEEQEKIADYLDKKCTLIDDAIAGKQKQLQTLEAYKKSLIYEYVTGKKEVTEC